MRAVLALLITLPFILIQGPAGATAQSACPVAEDMPSGCRQFGSISTTDGPAFIQVMSVVLPNREYADAYLGGVVDGLGDEMSRSARATRFKFGDDHFGFTAVASSQDVYAVAFRTRNQVAIWAVAGNGFNGFSFLYGLYEDIDKKGVPNDDARRVLSLLPALSDLPDGFVMLAEDFSGEITSSASGGSSSTSDDAGPPSQPANTSSDTALMISGSGTRSTEVFHVESEWTLSWSYDCTDFGFDGNFIVMIMNADGSMSFQNLMVNQLGRSGSGTEHYHTGGNFYLEVTSLCDWKITASN